MFYPLYQTPELNYSNNGDGIQVYLSNGAELFPEPLAPSETHDQIVREAEYNLLLLALRYYYNPIPFMMPRSDDQPKIMLTKERTRKIRYAAFLRGNIKYFRYKMLKALAGPDWKKIWQKANCHRHETFSLASSSMMEVMSVDAAMSLCSNNFHKEIEETGIVCEAKHFCMDDLYTMADAENIVIGREYLHPLERGADAPVIPDNVPVNDLPEPPVILPVDKAVEKFPLDEISETNRRLRAGAEEMCYSVRGTPLNRYQFMDYLVWAVSNGEYKSKKINTLSSICTGLNGTPTKSEVWRWRQWHPDFDHDLKIAEKIQAEGFADKALEIAMDCEDSKDVPVAKLQRDTLMQRAALADEKWRNKQVVQTEDLNQKNEIEIKRQLAMVLQNNPKLLEMLSNSAKTPGPIDVTPVDGK